MCLSGRDFVQALQVYCTSWIAIFLRADYHSAAPSDWVSNRHRFQYTQSNIFIKLFFNLLHPVHRDWYWLVHCHWPSRFIHVQFERGRGVDQGERLMAALVES